MTQPTVVGFSFKWQVVVPVLLVTIVALALWTLLATLVSSIAAEAIILVIIVAALASAIGLIRTVDAPKVCGAAVVLTKPNKVAGIYVGREQRTGLPGRGHAVEERRPRHS